MPLTVPAASGGAIAESIAVSTPGGLKSIYERTWSVIQVTGQHPTNPTPAANIVTRANDTSGTSNTLNLSASVDSFSRSFAFFFMWDSNGSAFTPKAGWTTIAEQTGVAPSVHSYQAYRADAFDASASWTAPFAMSIRRAIAIEVASNAGAAIVPTLLTHGGQPFAGGPTGSSTTASVTAAANSMVLIAVASGQGSPTYPVPRGLGLTWTRLATVGASGNMNLVLYRAQVGAAPVSGTITIEWPTNDIGVGGSIVGRLWRSGNWRELSIELLIGTAPSFGGGGAVWTFALPTGADAPMALANDRFPAGEWTYTRNPDDANYPYTGPVYINTTTKLLYALTPGTNGSTAGLSESNPRAIAAGDRFVFNARYPVA